MFAPLLLRYSHPRLWNIIVIKCTLALQVSQHCFALAGKLCNKYDKKTIYSYSLAMGRKVPKALYEGKKLPVMCCTTRTFLIRKLSLLRSCRGSLITSVRTIGSIIFAPYHSIKHSELTHIPTLSSRCVYVETQWYS